MKKPFVVMLAILVLGSVALVAVACGEAETTDTTAPAEETTVTEAEPAVLTVTEVKALGDGIVAQYKAAGEGAVVEDYSAGEVTFAGPVFAVSEKPDKYIVRVGTEEAAFALAIMKDALAGLGLTVEALNAWVGQNVEVSGEVVLNPFGGGAEIKITDAAQVVLQ